MLSEKVKDGDGKIVTEQPPSSVSSSACPPKCRPSIPPPLVSPFPPQRPPRWPAMLSSFINRRKVKSKISLFDAALRRAPSSPPLEAQSDQESPRPKQWTSLYKSSIPSVAGLRISALRRQSSPKVFLDFTPSGANDWFPQEILAPHEEDDHLPIQPVPESSTSSTYDDVVVIGPQRVPHVSPTQIPSKPPPRPKPSPALPPLPADSSSSPSPIEPTHGVSRLLFHARYQFIDSDPPITIQGNHSTHVTETCTSAN